MKINYARKREELHDRMETLAESWLAFAEEHHGKEFTDGEHAYGVMCAEYNEAKDAVNEVVVNISRFYQDNVREHDYTNAVKELERLYNNAASAAEEFAQIAAVALKTMGSGFVRKDVEE